MKLSFKSVEEIKILYVEDPTESTEKRLEVINKFMKLQSTRSMY